jgi:histidinol-phosphate aminotransferase
MAQATSRREWLRITAALAAGISISNNLYAEQRQLPAGMILLNSNENAYGPSANTLKAMAEAMKLSNRYPDDINPLLKQQLAHHWKVEPANILMGAGSSELLGLTAILASMKSKTMVSPFPTFQSWYKVAELMGATIKKFHWQPAIKPLILPAYLLLLMIKPHWCMYAIPITQQEQLLKIIC